MVWCLAFPDCLGWDLLVVVICGCALVVLYLGAMGLGFCASVCLFRFACFELWVCFPEFCGFGDLDLFVCFGLNLVLRFRIGGLVTC